VRRWLPPGRARTIASAPSQVLVVADDRVGAVGLSVGVALVTLCLFALLDGEQHGATVSPAAVAAAGAVVLGAAVVVAPQDSKDLWSYAMYGRILSVHHANPWSLAPAHFAADPYLARVALGWRHTTSIYGPAFEVIAAVVTRLAGDTAAAVRVGFASIFAGAIALAGWLVYRRTGRAAAAAVVVLHPAIVLGTVTGGHNDALVGLGLLGAVLLVLDDRPVLAGAAGAFAVLVKLTGAIGIVAVAAWALVHRGGRVATRLAVVAGGIVLLAYLPLGTTGVSAFVHNRNSISRASIWQLPRLVTGLDSRHSPIRLGLAHGDTHSLIALGAAATLVVMLAIAIWLRRADHPAIGLVASLGGYLVLAPYVLPWYAAWVVPALALVVALPIARLLLVQMSFVVVVYQLKTFTLSRPASDAIWWCTVLVSVGFAVAYLVTLLRSGRTTAPDAPPLVPRPAG
jgi:hypothetical protein